MRHSFLDGKTNLLIDCGMSVKLKESLHAIDVMPESIDALLITHEHVDHTKGAGLFQDATIFLFTPHKGLITSMDIGNIADENIKIITEDREIGSEYVL